MADVVVAEVGEVLIRGIPHETLIVHGRDDQVIPLENSTRLHALIQRSELHVSAAAGIGPRSSGPRSSTSYSSGSSDARTDRGRP
jgi:pimeloyl-ACP methyl ester carboxylesterase